MRARSLRTVGLAAAAVLAAGAATLAGAPPAAAAPYEGRLIIDVGHVDGLDIQSQGDQITMNVHDDRDPGNPVTRDPADVVFHVKPAAEFPIPEGLPPSYGFLGAPGTPIWLLPEVQDENLLWLGWATQRTAPGVIDGNLTLSMTAVDGPGDILLFQTNPIGEPINRWGSGAGLPPSVTVPPNAHVHSNWVFTQPGAYTVTFEATGRSAATGQTISTGPRVYTFHVGPLPAPPVETSLSIHGVADSYRTGEIVTLRAVQDPPTAEDHYHWFVKPAGAADFTVVNGALAAEHSFTADAAQDGAQYLVRLYDHDHAVIAESAPVTIEVDDQGGPGPVPPQAQTITATLDEDAGSLVVSVDPADRDVVMGPFALSGDGERWESEGELRPVRITDTRSTRPGWNVSGQVGPFRSGDRTVGSEHLGWAPVVTEQSPGQGVVAGPPVAPGSAAGEGLSVGRGLASAPAGSGLGTADAAGHLDLHLPTSTPAGTYTALLTLTAI
jgi:surface-anchored protein